MNKIWFVLLLFGLVAVPALAEDTLTQEQQQGGEETASRTGKAEPRDSAPAAPAPTFTPSEKVSADSAVSFPVDI